MVGYSVFGVLRRDGPCIEVWDNRESVEGLSLGILHQSLFINPDYLPAFVSLEVEHIFGVQWLKVLHGSVLLQWIAPEDFEPDAKLREV